MTKLINGSVKVYWYGEDVPFINMYADAVIEHEDYLEIQYEGTMISVRDYAWYEALSDE